MEALRESQGAHHYGDKNTQSSSKKPVAEDLAIAKELFQETRETLLQQRKKLKVISNSGDTDIIADDFTVNKKSKVDDNGKKKIAKKAVKINKEEDSHDVVEGVQGDEFKEDNHQKNDEQTSTNKEPSGQFWIGGEIPTISSEEEVAKIRSLEESMLLEDKGERAEYDVLKLKDGEIVKAKHIESPLINLIAKIRFFGDQEWKDISDFQFIDLVMRPIVSLNILGSHKPPGENLVISMRKDCLKIESGFRREIERKLKEIKYPEASFRTLLSDVDKKQFDSVGDYLMAASDELKNKRDAMVQEAFKAQSRNELLDLAIKQELVMVNYAALVRTVKASDKLQSVNEAKASLRSHGAQNSEIIEKNKEFFLKSSSQFALKAVLAHIDPKLASKCEKIVDSKVGLEILKDKFKYAFSKIKSFFSNIFNRIFGKKGQNIVAEFKEDALKAEKDFDNIVSDTANEVVEGLADTVSRALANGVQRGSGVLNNLLGSVNKSTTGLLDIAQANLEEIEKDASQATTVSQLKDSISKSLRIGSQAEIKAA